MRVSVCSRLPRGFILLPMSAVIKAIVFLIILFVMLYVGINNTDKISFSFPLLSAEKIRSTAALIYFGVFAVGVLAGTVLTAGGGGGRKRGSSAKEK